MGEIGDGTGSAYPSVLDTDATQEVNAPASNKTLIKAEIVNDLGAAVVAVETELGSDPAGTKATVKEFLQVEHNTDGTHYDIGAKVLHSAVQNVASGSATTMAFDSEEYDTDTMHDTSTNNSRLTIKTAGKYIVWAVMGFQDDTTGVRVCRIDKGGVAIGGAQVRVNAVTVSGQQTIIAITIEDDFVVDNYVELIAYQNSGSALYVDIGNTRFGIRRVG